MRNGFPDPQWAPLYAVWYFLLSLIQPDRVALYYLNYQLITILLPVALYAVLRRCRLAAPAAAGIAFFVLIGAINLPVWPKVSHFALVVILVTLAAAASIRSPSARWAVLCGGALLWRRMCARSSSSALRCWLRALSMCSCAVGRAGDGGWLRRGL